MTNKYLKETDSEPRIRRENWGSSLWKGICSVWHEMREACQNSIRNGKDTKFWTTRWLDDDIHLEDYAKIALSENDRQIKVSEISDGRGNWNWNYLRRYLPYNMVALISGMEPHKDDEQDDKLIWGPDPRVFKNKFVTCDQLRLRVLHWIVGVRKTMKANSQTFSEPVANRVKASISWKAAPEGWTTINTDGSVIDNQCRAAAGGILRDHQGKPITTFSANLGRCSVM
ncbi:hypothetical protein LINPERHAP1_LOCUS15617 [Linum perenne]